MPESLILVVNPGSASRKYALFADGTKKATIHFEFMNGRVIGTIEYNGDKQSVQYDDTDLANVPRYILPLLQQYNVISSLDKLSVIGIRIVAPTDYFTKDLLLTDEVESELVSIQQKAPLHIGTALSEIQHLKAVFENIPLVIISDSAFHTTKPAWATNYGVSTELAERFGIKRYGFHGISVGSVVRLLQESNNLMPKTIVCHLGSGSSVTALVNGESVDTTMGYTPLEGLMMATRCGNIDVAAALAIKRELQLDDNGLEEYLNKNSGLLGVSGVSDEFRQVLASEAQGNQKSFLALQMFVYKVQQAIGQMAASMGGVDCLVFTATIGERSFIIRERILNQLGYLGFENNKEINDATFEPKGVINIATNNSKPILILATDESAEIARRAFDYINNYNK